MDQETRERLENSKRLIADSKKRIEEISKSLADLNDVMTGRKKWVDDKPVEIVPVKKRKLDA